MHPCAIRLCVKERNLMGRLVRELDEWTPPQAQIQSKPAADLEVVLNESAILIAYQVVIERRDLCECACLTVQEVGKVVIRKSSAPGPRPVGVEVLVEYALVPRNVQPEIELMTGLRPRPRVLQIVLVARNAVKRVYGVAEVVRDRKTERISLGHNRHVDAERLISRKILPGLQVVRAAVV